MSYTLNLSESEKERLQESIKYIKRNIDFFTIRFYHYFLKTNAGFLFKKTNMETQYNMFSASLNIIFNHIDHPHQLEEHFDGLIENHLNYGILETHFDSFTESFMNAWEELFDNKYTELEYTLWSNLIENIMLFFKSKFL